MFRFETKSSDSPRLTNAAAYIHLRMNPLRVESASERPIRVLHLTTVDMTLALVLEAELRTGVGLGHDMHAASAPGPFEARILATGAVFWPVPAFRRDWSLRSDLAASRQVWRLVRAVRPDVLHTHTPKAGVVGRIVGRIAGVPVVVNSVHGLWQPRTGSSLQRLKGTLVWAVEAFASLFSHAELYLNQQDRDALHRFVRTKGEVVGSGIDLARFAFSESDRTRVRAEWGIEPDEVLVVGVGRQVAEKGIFELASAAQRLRRPKADGRIRRVRFVWVGPTDESKADAIGAAMEGLELVGMRDDMRAVYAACDVFALPSYREGLSMSGMEAAACGRALVVSDIRGCRELGRQGNEVLLVPPGDVDALEQALARFIDDAGLRTAFGESAARYATTMFDHRNISSKWWDVYRRLLASARAKRR